MKITTSIYLPLLLAFCSLWAASPAFAWDNTGHDAVALIAYDNMRPAARARLHAILKADPRKRNLLTAATWPDDIKSPNSGIPRSQQHRDWHYINIPFARPTDPPRLPAGRNVVTQIRVEARLLADKNVSPEERANALSWVEHLVGDIYQPLHTANRISRLHPAPKGDEGGNLFRLAGPVKNLHLYWDLALRISPTNPGIRALASRVEKQYPRTLFARQLRDSDPTAWAMESFRVAERVVYTVGPENPAKPPTPSAAYAARVRKVARRQIALAGYRLARVLDAALATEKE